MPLSANKFIIPNGAPGGGNQEMASSAYGLDTLTGNDPNLVTGTPGTAGNLATWDGNGDAIDGPTPPAAGDIVGTDDTQTLTNKTIDGASNTITNIATTSLASPTGSDTDVVTGTKGANGNLLVWNVDGDAVDSGVVAVSVALTDTAQEFTRQQNFDATTLVYGANISWDLDLNQDAELTMTVGVATLDNPTNLKDGGHYTLLVRQDGGGSGVLNYGTVYKWPGGTPPVLSTGANDIDILHFYSDGTDMYGTFALDYS